MKKEKIETVISAHKKLEQCLKDGFVERKNFNYIRGRLTQFENNTKFERYYIIQDSMFFLFDSQPKGFIDLNNPITSFKPCFSLHLANSHAGSCGKQSNYDHCFLIFADRFLGAFASPTEQEKNELIFALSRAKYLTHYHIVHDCYWQYIATIKEKKPLSSEPLAHLLLGKPDYIDSFGIGGGMHGFLSLMEQSTDKRIDCLKNSDWNTKYCIVKDSHFFIYDKDYHELRTPEFVLHLVQTSVAANDNITKLLFDSPFKFAFSISFENLNIKLICASNSQAVSKRWTRAVDHAKYVNINVAIESALSKENRFPTCNIPLETDIQGKLLDPMCCQSYTSEYRPLFRHPKGHLVTSDSKPYPKNLPRYSKSGTLLDCYNRTIPLSASVPYTNTGEPVGVGIDGLFYTYPSSKEFSFYDGFYDINKNIIPSTSMKKYLSSSIILNLKWIFNISIRGAMLRNNLFDAFGRQLKRKRNGNLITVDGEEITPNHNNNNVKVFNRMGDPIIWEKRIPLKVELELKYWKNEFDLVLVGKVINVEFEYSTLFDLNIFLKNNFTNHGWVFVFLKDGSPILEVEYKNWWLSDFLPCLTIELYEPNGKKLNFPEEIFVIEIDHDQLEAEEYVRESGKFEDFILQQNLKEEKQRKRKEFQHQRIKEANEMYSNIPLENSSNSSSSSSTSTTNSSNSSSSFNSSRKSKKVSFTANIQFVENKDKNPEDVIKKTEQKPSMPPQMTHNLAISILKQHIAIQQAKNNIQPPTSLNNTNLATTTTTSTTSSTTTTTTTPTSTNGISPATTTTTGSTTTSTTTKPVRPQLISQNSLLKAQQNSSKTKVSTKRFFIEHLQSFSVIIVFVAIGIFCLHNFFPQKDPFFGLLN